MTNHHSLSECLLSFCRRSLSFPLYRHFELSRKCIQDVVTILLLGREAVLRCLLEIQYLFDHSGVGGDEEFKFILNKIFVEDYCVWIQTLVKNDDVLKTLAEKIQEELNQTIKKTNPSLDRWGLQDLEDLAKEEFDNPE